jgi:predicted phosphodiesterase
MPKVALLSDVHANLPALEAVLAAIDARDDIDAVYHVGDLVGYAPWPNEVIELLERRGIAGVAGNYDSTVATSYTHCGCRAEDAAQEALAHVSFEWTCAHVTAANKRRLGALPFRLDVRPLGGHVSGPTLTLVHGAPTLNTLYWTADRSDDFCRQMAERVRARVGDVVAFGHTHRSWHRVVDGVHFINTGSVGRPKDGNPQAEYVVVEFSDGAVSPSRHRQVAVMPDSVEGMDHRLAVGVQFHRVSYDVERAATAIEAAGLPGEFAAFLRGGGKAARPA